jgi:D-glycero-D-manno-heptose 1,7-bisphosphate phosphatase
VTPAAVRLVLLDRDGTIVAEPPVGHRYLEAPSQVRLLPGVLEAIAALNDAGVVVAVITNQRGIATGVVTAGTVRAIHDRIADLLAPRAHVDDWFVCPHDVRRCDCRKPAPGLVLAALARFGVPPEAAVVVGNAESDLAAGAAAGVAGIGVGTPPPGAPAGHEWVPSAAAAVERILARSSAGWPGLGDS